MCPNLFLQSGTVITLVFPHHTELRNSNGKEICNSGGFRSIHNFGLIHGSRASAHMHCELYHLTHLRPYSLTYSNQIRPHNMQWKCVLLEGQTTTPIQRSGLQHPAKNVGPPIYTHVVRPTSTKVCSLIKLQCRWEENIYMADHAPCPGQNVYHTNADS